MPARWRWVIAGVAVLFVGLLIHGTLQQTKHRYEVCVQFNGHTHCATAEGRTQDEAIQAGKTIGCTLLTSGRDENIRCLDAPPARVHVVTND